MTVVRNHGIYHSAGADRAGAKWIGTIFVNWTVGSSERGAAAQLIVSPLAATDASGIS